MTSTPPSVDASGYLESLMRAGQDAMKQFDDALASAAGVGGKANSRGQFFFPFGSIADLQRDYIKQLWRLWNATFLQAFAGEALSDAEGDRRRTGSEEKGTTSCAFPLLH